MLPMPGKQLCQQAAAGPAQAAWLCTCIQLRVPCPACSACPLRRARGMRAPFGEGSAEFMRRQLAEWIDWSLNKCARGGGELCLRGHARQTKEKVAGSLQGCAEIPCQPPAPARRRSLPSSLLLLSRAFTVTQPLGRGPRAVDVHSLRHA